MNDILMPSNETERAQQQIVALGEAVASQVDLHSILEISKYSAPPPSGLTGVVGGGKISRQVRIGYPRDRAFGFYYPGDLEKMERLGARLIPFDALTSPGLPAVDGLFIGGGFPETAMVQLEKNQRLRGEILNFVEHGGPVYAECGGLMYLSRSLSWHGRRCEMVGAIQADVIMHERPQGRGYVLLEETGDSPWPPLSGGHGRAIRAHEFHYSALTDLPPDTRFAYRVTRGTGIDGVHDGIVHKNLLASYTHLRDVGGNNWTTRFLTHVASCNS